MFLWQHLESRGEVEWARQHAGCPVGPLVPPRVRFRRQPQQAEEQWRHSDRHQRQRQRQHKVQLSAERAGLGHGQQVPARWRERQQQQAGEQEAAEVREQQDGEAGDEWLRGRGRQCREPVPEARDGKSWFNQFFCNRLIILILMLI